MRREGLKVVQKSVGVRGGYGIAIWAIGFLVERKVDQAFNQPEISDFRIKRFRKEDI